MQINPPFRGGINVTSLKQLTIVRCFFPYLCAFKSSYYYLFARRLCILKYERMSNKDQVGPNY